MPIPSAPMKRAKTIRYKNPKLRSATDNPVINDAVAIKVCFLGKVVALFILLLYGRTCLIYANADEHIANIVSI